MWNHLPPLFAFPDDEDASFNRLIFKDFFASFRVWEIRFLVFLSFPLGLRRRWQKSASFSWQKSVYFWKMGAFLETDKRGNIKAKIVLISFSPLSRQIFFAREKQTPTLRWLLQVPQLRTIKVDIPHIYLDKLLPPPTQQNFPGLTVVISHRFCCSDKELIMLLRLWGRRFGVLMGWFMGCGRRRRRSPLILSVSQIPALSQIKTGGGRRERG